MKITLTRSGGIIPVTKKAETEVDWSSEELDELLNAIKTDNAVGKTRDGTSYSLATPTTKYPVDLDKVPAKYKKTFEQLKDNLQIIKQ